MFDFLNECQAMSKQIAEDRNYLHMHPELSGKEVETLHWIKERLDLMGIEYEQIEGGGIAALLKGRTSGKRLLLRADIDALPVLENEQNLCDFKGAVSKTAGVSHACGHDAHTAMLLAALKVLFQNRQEWSGEIVAVFEQGEESACGVVAVLEYLVKRFDGIDGCFAIHVNASIPEGKISARSGYVMCGALGVDVELSGSGGHSSRPDLCNNPTDCFVSIYNDIASIRMRHTHPEECLTHAICLLQGGSKTNIIPDKLQFSCMARFFREDVCGRPFLEALKKIIEKDAQIYDCVVKYNYIMEPTPSVYNDEVCAELANKCLKRSLGEDAVIKAEPWMASETYSLYTLMYSGVLAFLGIQNDIGCGAPHHSAEFDLNADMLYKGTTAFVSYAINFLDSSFSSPPRKPACEVLAQLKKTL